MSRRTFLLAAGAAGICALTIAGFTRMVRAIRSADGGAGDIALPPVATSEALPSANPFAVQGLSPYITRTPTSRLASLWPACTATCRR